VAVAADAEVRLVAADDGVARPPERDAPAGVEREVAVEDARLVAVVEQQAVLSVVDDARLDRRAGAVRERDARAVIALPVAVVILVPEQPVRRVLPFDRGAQVLLVVSGRVDRREMHARRVVRADADLESAHRATVDRHVLRAVDRHADAGERVRRRVVRGADQRDAREVESRPVALHVDHAVAVLVRDAVDARLDLHASRDDEVVAGDRNPVVVAGADVGGERRRQPERGEDPDRTRHSANFTIIVDSPVRPSMRLDDPTKSMTRAASSHFFAFAAPVALPSATFCS
jgi:hypothetical protein